MKPEVILDHCLVLYIKLVACILENLCKSKYSKNNINAEHQIIKRFLIFIFAKTK